MERLTYRLEDQYGNPTDSIILESDLIFLNSSEKWKKVLSRLASIEDILGDEYDLDRLPELVEADREGRCVVLPCKVEDDVYINILGGTLPFTVISISQMASTPIFKAQHGIRLVYIFKADDVGKTVFLTRADAEAALRREQDGE